jgi:putative ABC transport system permease protein
MGTALWNDVRFALRMMRRAPGFTVTVVLTIAIAIAANATIFTVVNAVMIRPLPYSDPGRIVQVAEKNDKLNLPSFAVSILNFLDWRAQSRSFEQLAAIGFNNSTLTGSGEPEQLAGNLISPALLGVVGLKPLAGRGFLPGDELLNGPPVAMLSQGFWKRRFGSDPSIVGRTIMLDGQSTLVVGVAPAALDLLGQGEIYTPLRIDPKNEIRLNHVILVIGRLRPGVTLGQAQAEMDAISVHNGQQYPEIRDWGIRLISLYDTFVSPDLNTGLLVLLVAVGLVLLIACANIANLLLARAATRQKEMALRTAIGATRGGLLRQALVESAVLAVAGGAMGLLGAWGAVRLLNRALPPNVLPIPDVQIDARVLWFSFALTVATGLIFGIAPALRSASVNPDEVLKQAGRGASGGIRGRLRDGLVASELALATVLLIGAGLLVESLMKLESVALGFESRGLITFELSPPTAKYPPADKAPQLYRALLDSLRTIPGARGTVITSGLPFGNGLHARHPMLTTGPSVLPPGTKVPIDWEAVSPGYFKVMNIPLLAGRDFTDADHSPLAGRDSASANNLNLNAIKVMIVSQSTARKFWGNDNPIGRVLRPSAKPELAYTVVGVVGDVRDTALNQATSQLYYPIMARPPGLIDVAVRTDGRPEALMPSIREKVRELDPELALASVRTEDEWVEGNAAQPRFNSILLATFAMVALLMAALGIYGVLAYSVNQRTREIGVRMALGAQRGNVLRLIVGEGMKVALVGVAIGLAGGLALGRFLSSLVFGITVRDPLTFAAVAVVLSGVALAACILPARRASRVDPMEALRYE